MPAPLQWVSFQPHHHKLGPPASRVVISIGSNMPASAAKAGRASAITSPKTTRKVMDKKFLGDIFFVTYRKMYLVDIHVY